MGFYSNGFPIIHLWWFYIYGNFKNSKKKNMLLDVLSGCVKWHLQFVRILRPPQSTLHILQNSVKQLGFHLCICIFSLFKLGVETSLWLYVTLHVKIAMWKNYHVTFHILWKSLSRVFEEDLITTLNESMEPRLMSQLSCTKHPYKYIFCGGF